MTKEICEKKIKITCLTCGDVDKEFPISAKGIRSIHKFLEDHNIRTKIEIIKICEICGRRIWFFQRKGYSIPELSGKQREILIHKKCYKKQK